MNGANKIIFVPSLAGKYALFFFCDLIRNGGVERVVPVSSARRRGNECFESKELSQLEEQKYKELLKKVK